MSLALSDDHESLVNVARTFLTDRRALELAHASLDADATELVPYWDELCELGWVGLHVPETYGGQGFGLAELAIVVEELGRVVGAGAFLPTAVASATIAACGTAEQRQAWLPGLVQGNRAAVGFGGSVARQGDTIDGRVACVLGATEAHLILVPVGDDVVVVPAEDVTAVPREGLDTTRSVADVELDAVTVTDESVLVGAAPVAWTIGRVLAAAEAAGGARACTEMAVAYAKEREQFGRPIGTFQAVKHHCADMLIEVELATAAAWEATRLLDDASAAPLAAAVAATRALPGYQRCADRNLQLHGGIGYTWEHPAHLYLRRAASLATAFGSSGASREVFVETARGATLDHHVELDGNADSFRAEARAFVERYHSLPESRRREALVDSGYLMPHWPHPFGRGAGAAEQLVIEEELAELPGADLGVGTWVLLTLLQCGTPDQVERWVRPGLLGEQRWCQLFSEPDAGSDAAAIKTRGTRVDGGWLVTGQKVWTSDAANCHRGLATVKTDPDAAKHAAISAFVIDLGAEGVEIRPLREITGETMFNEVFFDEVFVPDDDVVGAVNQGWSVARSALGNERVSIGANVGGLDLVDAADLVDLAADHLDGEDADVVLEAEIGAMLAESHAMSSLNLRHVMRALIGAGPGPEGAITKLLSAEHAQRVAEVAMRVVGPAAVAGASDRVTHTYLFSRCLTIGGGTSEIMRNVIAERLLGLPRDPLTR